MTLRSLGQFPIRHLTILGILMESLAVPPAFIMVLARGMLQPTTSPFLARAISLTTLRTSLGFRSQAMRTTISFPRLQPGVAQSLVAT